MSFTRFIAVMTRFSCCGTRESCQLLLTYVHTEQAFPESEQVSVKQPSVVYLELKKLPNRSCTKDDAVHVFNTQCSHLNLR